MKLKEWLPSEFFHEEHKASKANNYLEEEIISVKFYHSDPWPGKEVWVHSWVELANGKAVGWNENLQKGWSFPVITIKK